MKHNFRNLILRPNGCSRSPIHGGSPLGFHGIPTKQQGWAEHFLRSLNWSHAQAILNGFESLLSHFDSWYSWMVFRYGTPMMKVETSIIFGQHWLSFKVHPGSVSPKSKDSAYWTSRAPGGDASWLAKMIPTWIWQICLKLVDFPKSIGFESWLKYHHLGVYRYSIIYPIFGRSHISSF